MICRDHRFALSGNDRKAIAPIQEFYFGPDFLPRDYEVDISGSFPTAQYVCDIVEADGIAFPTKRRAHPRGADGRPNRDRAYVWIDLSDFGMS
jgi:hypothetical protein